MGNFSDNEMEEALKSRRKRLMDWGMIMRYPYVAMPIDYLKANTYILALPMFESTYFTIAFCIQFGLIRSLKQR